MRCWRASSRGPAAPRTDAADEGRDPYGEQGVWGVFGEWDCEEDEKVEGAYEEAYEDRDERAWYGDGDGGGYAAEHDGDGAWNPRPVADVVPSTVTDVLSGGSAPAPGDVSAMLVSGRRYGSVWLSGRGRSRQAALPLGAVAGGSLTTSSSSSMIRLSYCPLFSGSFSTGRSNSEP